MNEEKIGMAMKTETTLSCKERGKELECPVIAANKAGEGQPGNTDELVKSPKIAFLRL